MRLIFFIIILFLLILIINKEHISVFENIKNYKVKNALSNSTFVFTNEEIPKVIHKIYIDSTMGLDNIDPNVKELFNKIKKMNPGYELKIWSGEDCRKYLLQNFSQEHLDAFDALKPYAFKADFARYCILYNEGGWYSDLKEDPLVSFDYINHGNYSFIGIVDLGIPYCMANFVLQNAFFAIIPKHPLLKNCIEKCIENVKNKFYGNFSLEPTGPSLFGKEFEKLKSFTSNILLGFYIHDIPGGSHYINNKKVIIHKCDKCTKGNEWKYGNNWLKMWEKKDIYN
jgi:mannosyltransferase OCH1-like enzyme